MSFGKVIGWWLCCAIGVSAAIAISMLRFDIPIAQMFAVNINRLAPFGRGLGSAVLVTGEMSVMALLIAVRLATGHLSVPAKAILVSLVASLTTYAVNDFVLKIFFGIPNPGSFLFYDAGHSFNFLHGNRDSGFPSGHMALAASFASAFARIYWRTLIPLCAALILAGAALIVGDWHFLSDVIAGSFVGITAGLAAGELWIQHNKRRAS